jgi:hypothetical protein
MSDWIVERLATKSNNVALDDKTLVRCWEYGNKHPLGCGNVRAAALPACTEQACETMGFVRPKPTPAPLATDSDECKAAFALAPSGARTMALLKHCQVQPPR